MRIPGPRAQMEFRHHRPSDSAVLEDLFAAVFTESEGEEEGALIGNLVKEMLSSTDSQDLHGYVATADDQIVGAIFFSRLTFKEKIDAFIMAPVAIHKDYQGKGIGQALIGHGLCDMKDRGVQYVTTYGDPKFYSKVGFHPLSAELVKPPLELSQPGGWLGQSLDDTQTESIDGKCTCVAALDDQRYW